MAGLPRPKDDPRLLVGVETSDDAGVYRLNDDLAIVCTADFITPVLDDPYLYGQIAAANSLSDVYAMGGAPSTAIALCMFPKALEANDARAILAGGQDKVSEAGAAVVGGHTVRGEELFYGLSVTGVVHPNKIIRNVGVRAGDALILTKPLGTGLLINGLRKGAIELERAKPILERLAVLNRAGCEAMVRFLPSVHAATDVTGFGLVGHARHMAVGSKVGLRFHLPSLPLYPHVREMVEKGVTTGSTKPNRELGAPLLRVAKPLEKFWDELIHDPQTSGGLLIAVEEARAAELCSAIDGAVRIGEALATDAPFLEFVA
jgi:selenide,water dikinase